MWRLAGAPIRTVVCSVFYRASSYRAGGYEGSHTFSDESRLTQERPSHPGNDGLSQTRYVAGRYVSKKQNSYVLSGVVLGGCVNVFSVRLVVVRGGLI